MAWTQADLDAINAAIATGAKRVRFQTHEVEYQSMTDLLRARDLIKAEVEGATAGCGPIFTEYCGGY
ncbi:phage head-tail joining protein [Rhizobium ruizarguesonis]|jgi:hypothetical protein|uniref:phage head-tail joining protein n=1 Tax=Rhizobium TaxID=379 RepID=UPI001031966A|nr:MULTISPECIES: hypothetical protein [Rhizobium]MBB4590179.1 hypothetical protein [Rhizobium leguminosarum]MBY2918875.1 hypothetical protein [Rhizobium leguminosarum]MBY2974530.1 hypothetical protein [Rhizobium leguminosarum]MBY2982005.1 hypothetical protein [Rhizobium leguminosarum]MBY3010479.1 hypothetical protein [Rhizobium leguminosarum]